MKKLKVILISTLCISLLSGCAPKSKTIEPVEQGEPKSYRSIAYVTVPASDNWRWIGNDENGNITSDVDTDYVTHINFAFGMLEAYQYEDDKTKEPLKDGDIVSKEAYKNPEDNKYHYQVTLNGWIEEMQKTVEGGEYLKALVALKEQKPDLKVLLSIGGWDSDGFCYMAHTKEGRTEFIESAISIIHEYGIDGIDIDWEYPSVDWGVIAACDDCEEDAKKLLIEFREALDKEFPDTHKLLTIASGASTPWVDEETFKVLDYMNVMCYDFDSGSGQAQADLERSEGFMIDHLLMVGDTPENRSKINLGVPFYNEGGPYLVPYHKGWDGHIDTSPEILVEKMNWVKEYGYGGAFYWAYSMDVYESDVSNPDDPEIKILQRTVYKELNKEYNDKYNK
ncbi:MAG: glycosyl hydrolase family 18 protein [Coprobacillaceae bacterium]